MSDVPQRTPVSATRASYIKLGATNAWFAHAKENELLEFGHPAVPMEVGRRGNTDEIRKIYARQSRSKAGDYAREVLAFYHTGPDMLWITFAEGCLWWAFAESEVIELNDDGSCGARGRRLRAPWSNRNINGEVLTMASLSSRLTQTAAYRQTICAVREIDYLLRKINGTIEPSIAAAEVAIQQLEDATGTLLEGLHWRDFEIVCDLILARSGWRRASELGGLQKDTDLVLEQPATGERAFVQIKSRSNAPQLADYISRFESDPGFDRMFYLCHKFTGSPSIASNKPVHMWDGKQIARQAVAAGLVEWLIAKAG